MRTHWSTEHDRYGRMRSLLAQVAVLRGCSIAELDELGQHAIIQRYAPLERIASQAEPADSVFLVPFGRVRLTLAEENGRELTLAELGQGDFFGDEALTGAARRRATATALDEVTVVAIPAESLGRFLHGHPRVACNFVLQLSRALGQAADALAMLGLLGIEERLVRALEQLAREHGVPGEGGLVLRRLPTHQDLAARLGACRETVTRAFAALKRRGVLVPAGDGLLLRLHPAAS